MPATRLQWCFVSLRRVMVLLACLALPSCSVSRIERVNFPLTVRQEMDLPTHGSPVSIAWSADGSKLAAASNWGFVFNVWDRSGHRLSEVAVNAGGMALSKTLEFTPDGTRLLFNLERHEKEDVSFEIVDWHTGAITQEIDGPRQFHFHPCNRAQVLRVSPDGAMAAMSPVTDFCGDNTKYKKGDDEAEVYLYDTKDWRIHPLPSFDGGVQNMNYFDCGDKIVVGVFTVEQNPIVYILDAKGEAAPVRLAIPDAPVKSVTSVAGSPDGKLLFVGLDGSGPGPVGPYNPHGPPHDSVARVVRAADGDAVATLPAVWGPVRAAAWDPQNRYVAFLDDTGDLYIWRPFARVPSYVRIPFGVGAMAMQISPDGNHIAVNTDNSVRVFSIN